MRTIDDTFDCVDFDGDFIENSPTWQDLLGDECEDCRLSSKEWNELLINSYRDCQED